MRRVVAVAEDGAKPGMSGARQRRRTMISDLDLSAEADALPKRVNE
jgi:hypothetical protein